MRVYYFLISLLIYSLYIGASGKKQVDKKRESSTAARPTTKLNVDILPPLVDVLAELELSSYLKGFIRMGVTETRLLLKLSSMDFQLMSMDWEDFNKDKINKLREKIKELVIMATVIEEPSRPELAEREKLIYGRVYIPMGVQSFEFNMASFGGPPPLGKVKLVPSESVLECDSNHTTNYNGNAILVMRGNCTFLQKALNAKSNNASGMLVVNNEDKLESPASGVGINRSVSEDVAKSLGSFYMVSLSNITWQPLSKSIEFSTENSIFIDIVPLKCKVGGRCEPVTKEEKALQDEVSSGKIRVKNLNSKEVKSFEFLTSNFGSFIPVGVDLPLLLANPITACGNISVPELSSSQPFVLVAHRGECKFDVKSVYAHNAGARMLLLIDKEDHPLQRMGGQSPDVGFTGIPTVLVTAEAGNFISSGAKGNMNVLGEFFPSSDDSARDNWMEIAFINWPEDPEQKSAQIYGLIQKFESSESHDIVSWLHRRLQDIEHKKYKSIDTDEF